ncbi:MAG: hypothetical protein KF819_08250 [Labilithrix sp.]|nr:hypothetical protein [Labilithrix sp.]
MIAALAHGCREPTQVTVVLRSPELTCGALRGAQITIAPSPGDAEARADGEFLTATATPCTDPSTHELGTLVVTPGSTRRAAIIVVAGIRSDARSCKPSNRYDGCVVARRNLAFVDGVRLMVPISIEPACVDVPCDVATTCKAGECISSELDCRDDGSCTSIDPRGRDDDAGAPSDAGDAATDALTDGPIPDAPADAPIESGDGSALASCPSTCTNPIDFSTLTCAGETRCCYTVAGPGGGPSPTTSCKTPDTCINEPVTRKGIVLCCRDGSDCSGGDVCCFTPVDPPPALPRGAAVCMNPGACVAPRMILCTGAACAPPTPACMTWAPAGGYGTNLTACH